MNRYLLKVATDFSRTPGPRLVTEGPFSGEQFRTNVLWPAYKKAQSQGQILVVDLDGTAGYGTSFLEEAFGGLIRENGVSLEELKKSMEVVSIENPDFLDEVNGYMDEAEENR